MATEVGIVKTLIGTVTATAVDGSQRILQVGDRIYADEVINTNATGIIELEFSDGSLVGLGRNSETLLDNEFLNPQLSTGLSAEDDVNTMQQALLEGKDPSQTNEPTAAGNQLRGNEGITAQTIAHIAPEADVTSGFETIPVPLRSVSPENYTPEDTLTLAKKVDPADITDNDAADTDDVTETDREEEIEVDKTATGAPTITIIEDSNNDGILANSEISDDTDISIGLPAEAVANDILNVTINDVTTPVTLTADIIAAGEYLTSVATPAEGVALNVSATLTDQSGNTSASVSDSAVRNSAPTLTINSGDLNNAPVNESALSPDGTNPNTAGRSSEGTFTISDADGLSDIESITINGTTLSIADLASNNTVTGSAGTLTITNFDSTTGVVTYSYQLTSAQQDNDNTVETDNFNISTSDGKQSSIPAVLTIEIVDDAPALTVDTNAVDDGSNQIANGNVLANDKVGADGGVVTTTTPMNGSYGSVVINANGEYTYTLDNSNEDIKNLAEGDTFTEQFSYSVTDSDGDVVTSTLTITITGTDKPTVTVSDAATTPEDTALIVDAANGILGNDSDIDSALNIASFAVDTNNNGANQSFNAGDTANIADVGALTINLDGSYTFTPAENWSGNAPQVDYTTNTGATDTLDITVTAVADAPTLILSVSENATVPPSQGLDKTIYSEIGKNGVPLNSETLENLTDSLSGGVLQASNHQPYRDGGNGSDNITIDSVEVTTGLIYLEAGSKISFSGHADDSLLIELGGKTLVSTTGNFWGSYDTSEVAPKNQGNGTVTPTGDFTAAKSGYYTLEMYIYNHGGVGKMSVNVTVDGETTPLNTSNLSLYPDIETVDAANGLHGVFKDLDFDGNNTDGGFYPENYVYTLNVDASLTDVDGSESLSSITINDLPDGTSITSDANSDGTYNPGELILASEHELSAVEINSISGSVTATESSNGDTATTVETAKVEFDGLDATGETGDLLIEGNGADNIIIAGNGDDIILGGSGNDTLTGGAGADEFIWNKTDASSSAADEVTDFNASAGDVLNLADLLSDGSHTIEGLAANDGSGDHLQISIKDGGSNIVQTIDLTSVVTTDATATDMLDTLLQSGNINDGI